MRYVVLGGGGSFGLSTSRFLLQQKNTKSVIGVGRSTPKPCFALEDVSRHPHYEYHSLHLNYEMDMLLELLEHNQPDVIINFAAQGESATSFHYSWRYFETNTMALSKLIGELQRRLPNTRFIQISTSELYGATERPALEESPIVPTSPYAISKAAFDMYLIALHRHSGFPMNIIRPCNCYGAGQQLHRVIPKAVLCGLTGAKLPLHGGGYAEKTYMHNRDLASAIWTVIHSGQLGTVYNAGSAGPVTIRYVVSRVAERLNMSLEDLCVITGDRDHQDKRYVIDSSRLRGLGWQPVVEWKEGLSEMVDWAKAYLPLLKTLPTTFQMRA